MGLHNDFKYYKSPTTLPSTLYPLPSTELLHNDRKHTQLESQGLQFKISIVFPTN